MGLLPNTTPWLILLLLQYHSAVDGLFALWQDSMGPKVGRFAGIQLFLSSQLPIGLRVSSHGSLLRHEIFDSQEHCIRKAYSRSSCSFGSAQRRLRLFNLFYTVFFVHMAPFVMWARVKQVAAASVLFGSDTFVNQVHHQCFMPIRHIFNCSFIAVIQQLLFKLPTGDQDDVPQLIHGDHIVRNKAITGHLLSLAIFDHNAKLSTR